jgi:arylsulfatase A-like enzyme
MTVCRLLQVLVVFAAYGLVCVAESARANDRSPPESPPNIVLIISDDQGWTDFSFMCHPHIHTPNLDRLANESLTFTRGYVPSSLCCPSLASIITGLYPHQHKITSNDPPIPSGLKGDAFRKSAAFNEGREQMNRDMDQVPTLPRLLSKAGYVSLQTGKWWQGNYKRGGFTEGMTKGERHGDVGLEIGRKTIQPIYDFMDKAEHERKPFFVWYAPMMPHAPHNPPQRLMDKYAPVAPSLQVAKYWGMIEWFDETVGSLLKHLDEQNLSRNTIVIFVTDNGWITNPKSGGYAPKSKLSQYDGGLRTPIMIRWPGHVKPERSQALTSSLDIAPTLLAAAHLQPSSQMSGINLLDHQSLSSRKAIFGECFTHNAVDLANPSASLRWRWMIERNWKLIVPDSHNQPKDPVELYDLSDDPFEERNEAEGHVAKVKTMTGILNGWWNGASN